MSHSHHGVAQGCCGPQRIRVVDETCDSASGAAFACGVIGLGGREQATHQGNSALGGVVRLGMRIHTKKIGDSMRTGEMQVCPETRAQPLA